MIVLLACAAPDPTHRLGPDVLLWAPANLDADATDHRRWLERWAIVGTRPDPDVGAAVEGYADLPREEAIEALTSALHGPHAHEAAARLTHSYGEAGCRAVFDAWNEGTLVNRHHYESALLGPDAPGGCAAVVDLAATARGRAALSARRNP